MILLILGLLDIAIGSVLVAYGAFGAGIVVAVGIIALLKGMWSIISGIASGFWLDVLGFLDLLAGISLILGFSIPYLWAFVILKGVWSMIMGLVMK